MCGHLILPGAAAVHPFCIVSAPAGLSTCFLEPMEGF